jgi:hypothetical protein
MECFHGAMPSWHTLIDSEAERLGLQLFQLVADPADWILRRVEDISITSTSLVRRTVTVDIALPEDRSSLRVDPEDMGSPLVVPLGALRKEPLIDFDVVEDGRSLSLTQSTANSRLAAGIMWNLAVLDGCDVEAADRAIPHLQRIAAPDVEDAFVAFRSLFLQPTTNPDATIVPSRRTRELAEQLCDAYLLLVELPDVESRRRLVRFATDQVVARERSPTLERLGLQPTVLSLAIPSSDRALSYHAEISVPAGCVIDDPVVLTGSDLVPTRTHVMGRRATVYLGEAAGDRLEIRVGHDSRYFLLPAAVISGLVALVLAAGTAVVWAGVQPESTASALLLSGLGAVSGLVIRADEEELTAEIHSLARIALIVVMAAALAAAGCVAFGANGTTLGVLWSLTLAAAAAGAGILIKGAYLSRR